MRSKPTTAAAAIDVPGTKVIGAAMRAVNAFVASEVIDERDKEESHA